MLTTPTLKLTDPKRRPASRAKRHRAQDLIKPVRDLIPAQFENAEDSEEVARYLGAIRASVLDVVIAAQGQRMDGHDARLAAVERRLGMRRAEDARGRVLVLGRSA